MLAVVVRELSKHQSVSCLIVVFVIARFVSLSCYSSAKTRIRLVKSYQIFLCTEVYGIPSHKYIKMTVTKTNTTISPMQQMTSRWVARYLRCHFEWHINMMVPGHPQMILGACRDRMHEIKVSLDGFTIRKS